MRSVLRPLALALALCAPPGAEAAGFNRVHLVPALAECTGYSPCPRAFQSRYTFETITLFSAAGRYLVRGKPPLMIQARGVRDPAGALASGELRVRVLSGRVSVPGFGTFPDDTSVTQQPPFAIPLKGGNSTKVAYRPTVEPGDGTIVNGGGVEVYDPEGNLLAVTGSQTRPPK